MIHNTAMAQFIPPNAFNYLTGTWTDSAGPIAGQPSSKKTAAAETSVINIPVLIPSNSVALVGGKLASIEIDYEIRTAALTSLTPVVNKITRGEDLAVSVVAAQAFTQTPTLAVSDDVDQHRLILTITTPFFVDNDVYVMVELTAVCAATSVLEFYGAVANFTYRA